MCHQRGSAASKIDKIIDALDRLSSTLEAKMRFDQAAQRTISREPEARNR
jgi:hypothetical protein